VLCLAAPALAQPRGRPVTIEGVDPGGLAGDWFEVANTASGPHRRCLGDTRFTIQQSAGRSADIVRVCRTRKGTETRRGRMRAPGDGSGALSVRFAPAAVGWLPGVWKDHWVLDAGDGRTWLLLGDRRRRHLSVWARVVSLDEASLANAIGTARRQGYDVERLRPVPHPAGAISRAGVERPCADPAPRAIAGSLP
jgi:apolipoprotein D and lipocalin family protein